MKTHDLLYSVAVIAALAVSPPVWAQRAGGNAAGGNSMGIPGPNPGGPEVPGTPNGGLFGHTPSPAPASTSATPPRHHYYAHHVTHTAAHHRKMARLTGDTANQLNQEELTRLQAGSSMPPPAAVGAMPPSAELPSRSGGNSMGMPGPNPGGPGLTPYNR